MSFFYDLNKKLNSIGNEQEQIAKEVAKAANKSPVRKSLEESLRSDMKSLMEGQADDVYVQHPGGKQEKVKWAPGMVAQHKDGRQEKVPHPSKMAHKPKKVKEDGTGGMNFSGSGSLEEKAGYSAKKAAAGKDIGKPGKNFAKIEKSAGGGEKGKRIAGAVLAKLRAAKESVEEASAELECNTPAPSKGIPGNIPVPGKMDRLKGKRDYYETDEADDSDEDIMDYLNRKLAPHDKEQQTKEDAISKPYNGPANAADAYNGMEFEGNAFTGKLASTPKGGKFTVGGEEYTDTSELDEAMTRQHFQHTADLLKHIEDPVKRKQLAQHHAGIFKASNPRFDHGKFMKACNCDEGIAGQAAGTIAGTALAGPIGGAIGGAIGNNLTNEEDFEEGNAFTGKLASTPKGGKFELDGKEYTDNSDIDEGFDEMHAWLKKREKEEKGTNKFDKRKVSTGTVYTRKPETFDEPEDREDDDSDEHKHSHKHHEKRGRGRPKGTKHKTGSRGPTGKSKLMSKDAIHEFEVPVTSKDEYDQEGDEIKGDMHTVIRHAHELEKHLKDSENLPTWVIEKIGQIKGMMTMVSDYMMSQHERNVEKATGEEGIELDEKAISKKQQRFFGMVDAAKKGEKPASPEVAKVAKGISKKAAHDFASTKHKGLPEKVKAKKKDESKEEKVEETTTSGSVATSETTPKKSKGMSIGQGIYDSFNKEVETIISESINVATNMSAGDDGQDHENITISVDGDDVARFKELLQHMGIEQHDHSYEPHSDEPCSSCGGVPCQCDEIADEGMGGHVAGSIAGGAIGGPIGAAIGGAIGNNLTNEADAPVTQNEPDYPSNKEETDNAFQYSGGLNGPKSTGQSTIPVLASQKDRQVSESESFLNLYKAIRAIDSKE